MCRCVYSTLGLRALREHVNHTVDMMLLHRALWPVSLELMLTRRTRRRAQRAFGLLASRCFNNSSSFLPPTSVSYSIPISLHPPICSSFLTPSPQSCMSPLRSGAQRLSASPPLPWKQRNNSRLATAAARGRGVASQSPFAALLSLVDVCESRQ